MRSQDGGESWTVANQDSLLPHGVWAGANVKAVPGKAKDVWVSLDQILSIGNFPNSPEITEVFETVASRN